MDQMESIIVSKEKFDRWCRNINKSKKGYSYIWFCDDENIIQKRRIFKAEHYSEGLICNSPCGYGWCRVFSY